MYLKVKLITFKGKTFQTILENVLVPSVGIELKTSASACEAEAVTTPRVSRAEHRRRTGLRPPERRAAPGPNIID